MWFSDVTNPEGSSEATGALVCLVRAPLMPLLTVEEGCTILFRPFKSPLKGHQPGKRRNEPFAVRVFHVAL